MTQGEKTMHDSVRTGSSPLLRGFTTPGPGVRYSGILIEAPSDSDIMVQAIRVRYRQNPGIADPRSSGLESCSLTELAVILSR